MYRPSAAPLVGLALLATAAAILRRRPIADLQDRVVLVTGSSRGLGLALAEEFASHGARLVLCARTPEPLERARQRLEARGTEVLAVECDVTKREEIDNLIARANARFGQIDVLVNNAGVITVGPVDTQTIDDFEEAMRVMFWGPLYMTMAVLPAMRARGEGRIVNVTSVGGRMSVPHLLPYSSAKFAAVGFSEGLHAELARDGIHVTTVVPGLMRTGSHVNVWTKGNHQLEYTLFSLLATLPFTSIDAREAARQIVRATRRGDADVVLSIQAKLAVVAHGLLPGTVQNAFGIVSRFMPSGDGSDSPQRVKGRNSANSITESFLTALGRRAAADLNQGPD
jgi:NAD(P)-dependent dehydrogenase (short-subunit alcohol dehydrogenase family)